jgi:hypothetical protein
VARRRLEETGEQRHVAGEYDRRSMVLSQLAETVATCAISVRSLTFFIFF